MSTPAEPEVEREPDQEESGLHGHMSFFDHLEELRVRIINILVVLGLTFAGCLWSSGDLFKLLSMPMFDLGVTMVGLELQDGFSLQIKVALVAAVYVAAPYLLGQVWMFISPGLYRNERRYALPFIIFSTVLFYLGGVFGYLVAFPFTIDALLEIQRSLGLIPTISATSYFDMFVIVELGLGLVFQIPPVIFVLSRFGLVTPRFLIKNLQYAVLIIVVVAAIITPTGDAYTLAIVAVPMIALYILGILVALPFGKKKKKDEAV